MIFNGMISMILLIPAENSDELIHTFCKKASVYPKGDKKGHVRLKM